MRTHPSPLPPPPTPTCGHHARYRRRRTLLLLLMMASTLSNLICAQFYIQIIDPEGGCCCRCLHQSITNR